MEREIVSVIRKSRILDPDTDPVVEVFPENGEMAIKVQSFLKRDIDSKIKAEMGNGMDKDVLVFMCLGNASVESIPSAVDLTCDVVTENGLPVSIKGKTRKIDLGSLVRQARDEIIAVFESAREKSWWCSDE
jgi:hypothetical protein